MADAPTQPSSGDDRKITAGKIRSLYEASNKSIARELREFEIAKSFLANEQWVSWNRTTNSVASVPRDPNRVRRTNNRLTPSTRTIMAKLLRRALVFEVPPMGSDDATIQGARTAAAVLHHTHSEHKWEQLREEQILGAWQGGTGLLAVDWDPQAGTGLGVNPETGKEFGTGDIVCSALSIAEVATVPGTRDIERARWWIRAVALPPEEVRDRYGLNALPQADVQGAVSPLKFSGENTDEVKANLTLVLHYYERPFGKQPGQVAVMVGDKLIDGPKPWPFKFKDRLNVVALRDIFVLTRWTGDAILWTAIPQQTGLNLSESSIAEHMKLAANARIAVPAGSIDDLDQFTDEVAEVFEYVPVGGQKPDWMSPPQMPAWWQQEPERLSRDIDDVLGVHDISRGEAPSGVDSGVALSLLAEQDDTPVGKFARASSEAWGRYASLVLSIYEQKVTGGDQREARIDVPGQPPETRRWSGEAFKGQTTAVVPFDAVSPMSRTAQFSRAKTLWDMKIISDPKQFARLAEMPGADDFTEGLDPDVAKARRENHALSLGEVLIPAPFDHHATHIAEHNRFRKSPRYEELTDDGRLLIDLHVAGHAAIEAEEKAKLVGMIEGGAPALAAGAHADEPDPIDPAAIAPPMPPAGGPAPAGMPPAPGDAAVAEDPGAIQ